MAIHYPNLVESASMPVGTPVGRLLSAMFIANVGALVALFTPIQLLMTLHLTRIAGNDAAAAFGLVTGFGALVALVANPLGGRVSDRTTARFGRRRTWILFGSLGGSAIVACMGFTTQVWQVIVLWCLVAIFFNFQFAATGALMADQVPQARRGTASGLLGFSAAVGPLAGIAAAGWIRDPQLQWFVLAALAAVLGIVAVLLIREERHQAPKDDQRLGLGELARSLWLNPMRYPAFGWAWLIRFLLTCGMASGTYTAFFMMDRFGIKEEEVAGIVLITGIIMVVVLAVTSVVAGPLSDRLRKQKPFIVAAATVSALALVLMAFAAHIWMVYVATGLLGLAAGLMVSVDTAMCVRVLPNSENAGKDLGIINIANTIPQSVVPFVAPFLLALGGFTALYLVLSVTVALAALAVLRIPEVGQEGNPRWAAIVREPKATLSN